MLIPSTAWTPVDVSGVCAKMNCGCVSDRYRGSPRVYLLVGDGAREVGLEAVGDIASITVAFRTIAAEPIEL